MEPISFLASLGFSTLALLMLLGLALLFSSYLKIATVLGMVRLGLGFDSLPGTLIVGALSLALTYFVMFPTLLDSARAASRTLQAQGGESEDQRKAAALGAAFDRWKTFVESQVHPAEKERFTSLAKKLSARPKSDNGAPAQGLPPVLVGDAEVDPASWRVLAPAFMVSELKEAFATGINLLLPFLVIDLVVASLLAGVGLDRFQPAVVSFPFKVLLFVMTDGWTLITANLVSSYA